MIPGLFSLILTRHWTNLNFGCPITVIYCRHVMLVLCSQGKLFLDISDLFCPKLSYHLIRIIFLINMMLLKINSKFKHLNVPRQVKKINHDGV